MCKTGSPKMFELLVALTWNQRRKCRGSKSVSQRQRSRSVVVSGIAAQRDEEEKEEIGMRRLGKTGPGCHVTSHDAHRASIR